MRKLTTFLVFAFLTTLACGQGPDLWRDVTFDSPTVAPAAPAGQGGALARVTPSPEAPASAETTPSAETPSAGTSSGQDTATAEPAAEEGSGDGHDHEHEDDVEGTLEAVVTAEAPAGEEAQADAAAVVGGALVRVTLASDVGVLLDEFPPNMRPRVVEGLRELPPEEWLARAERQIKLTRLRLNFRDSSVPGKGQLPLTQPELWTVTLDEAGPQVRTIQGHELLSWSYTFSTTILTDAASLAAAEPALSAEGDVWDEYFLLPADPDMLLQRTGRACINDGGFPPNSVDTQNAGHFYDYDRQNCFEVLAARVGVIETAMRFERLPWDDDLADSVRTPLPEMGLGADLAVVARDLEYNYVTYRYVGENDCALVEGAVGGSGWRRLLHFEATVHNVGDRPLHIGRSVAGGGPEDSGESVFVYAPCHDHVHYRNYGIFTLDEGQLEASKQAFCVQSTDRMSNHELSPMIHDYSCRFQGIQVGWVDEYIAGLDTQWVDITDVDIGAEGRTLDLGFVSNPEGFLCEGLAGFDENGELLWEPSGLQTADGVDIFRPQCVFAPEWDANNTETLQRFVPQVGSVVTAPCANGELGPLRDCGFEPLPLESADATCRVGQPLDLPVALQSSSAPMIVRACERSAALGIGIPCSEQEALDNIVLQDEGFLSFVCPAVRDGQSDEGNFALFVAPLWQGDEAGDVVVNR